MTIKVWNVPATVGQFTPCNHALNWFVLKHCKDLRSANVLQLLSYPANLIDTSIRMLVQPVFALIRPYQEIYAAYKNNQQTLFKNSIRLLIPTILYNVAETVLHEAYYAALLVVHLTGLTTIWNMIHGYDIATGYFKSREETEQSQKFGLTALDFFPSKPNKNDFVPVEPCLNIKTSVTEFTPITHMLNKFALEQCKGTWKAHAIQFLAYPASILDTVIRMAVLPVLEAIAPLYDIYKNIQKENYGKVAEAVLLLPLTYVINILTTALYEVRYACTLAVHLSGITTLSALFLGDERAESYFLRRENVLHYAGSYGNAGEVVKTAEIELATLRSNIVDGAHKMLKGFCQTKTWMDRQKAAGWQIVDHQEDGDENYSEDRVVLDPLPAPVIRRRVTFTEVVEIID